MLQQIRIQNFKSLKDVTLDLQQVNLLIGPNNSGKSNLLKALEFLGKWFEGKVPEKEELLRLSFQRELSLTQGLIFRIDYLDEKWINPKYTYQLEIFDHKLDNQISYREFIGLPIQDFLNERFTLSKVKSWDKHFKYYHLLISDQMSDVHFHHLKGQAGIGTNANKFYIIGHEDKSFTKEDAFPDTGKFIHRFNKSQAILAEELIRSFDDIAIYKPDPITFSAAASLEVDSKVNSTASNLVSFLDNIKEENPSAFRHIENDLHFCVPEFTNITLPKTKAEKGYIEKKIRLLRSDGLTYWADEVSEGVLYFLALLCIIHQPNPPKLLLLEEPEKGIHPRRIKEVMRFIFQLAEEKGIQVILTSHSVHVVDEFASSPESVFIFDKDQEGATTVKNLQKDIIEPSDKKSAEAGISKISYTEPLGEHWVMGFLGGVPE